MQAIAEGADGEEDLANIEDLDGPEDLNEKDLETVKKYYGKYKKEKQEEEMYISNLSKKLEKLKQNLDEQTEQVEQAQRNLQIERHKDDDTEQGNQREKNAKIKDSEERIREHLSEALFAKPAHDASGAPPELDTVVVSYLNEVKTCRYNLYFRVDSQTSVKDLRTSACRYWGQKNEDYVLKTMANNKCQDDIMVVACFRQGELAQLQLEKKDPDPSEKPTPDEMKACAALAIARKAKKQKKGGEYDVSAVDNLRKQQESHNQDMRKLGGTYFLLKRRDHLPPEHRSKINVRDICAYSFLVFLTFYSYFLRRPYSNDYWFVRGFEDNFAKVMVVGNKTIPSFLDIKRREEVEDWLGYTMADMFYGDQHLKLGDYNLLLGYAAIRVQLVTPPEEANQTCGASLAVVQQLEAYGAHCTDLRVNEDSRETRTFVDLRNYWDKRMAEAVGEPSHRLRGPTKPYLWQENKNRGIPNFWGTFQDYDASGYMAEYRMDVAADDAASEFRQDIMEFRRYGWLSSNTRIVFISFTAYHFDYDLWASVNLVLEIADSGRVIPKMQTLPFRPRIMETRGELSEAYMDYARLVLAIYILIFVGQHERTHKIKNHQAGCWYHVSLNGICDLGAVFCIITMTFWRNLVLYGPSTGEWLNMTADISGTQGFQSMHTKALNYQGIYSVEGLLIVFLMYRMVSFFRLSRTVYLLWHALGLAFKTFVGFAILLVPTVLGFMFLLHLIYGPYDAAYSTLPNTMLSVYHLMQGGLDIEPLIERDTVWAFVIVACFYIMLNYILLNIFATIVIDAYHVGQLVDGGPGGEFSWTKWAIPNLCVSLWKMISPSQGSEVT